MSNSYEKSGVSITDAEEFVEDIKSMSNVDDPNFINGIGGFGALFALDCFKYKNPVIVSSTDGVGTKILIARDSKIYDSIGIDLVAMCVNDIICHGAKPLFFLDYFATNKLDISISRKLIQGIVNGCKIASIPLVGGETAQMPDLYQKSDFDLAGFVVGIVEKEEILPRKNISSGDIVIGLKSSGFHSNGFSLIRKIFNDLKINYSDCSIFNDKKWYEILLQPTLIYIDVLKQIKHIKAIAHITGGGIIKNFAPRVITQKYKFEMSYKENNWPDLFRWIKEIGKISYDEMLLTFNCGIGMVIVTSFDKAHFIFDEFKDQAIQIGVIRDS